VKPPAGLLWSVTDDYARRQRAKPYWPPKLCVGGPVITTTIGTNYMIAVVYQNRLR